MPAKNAIKQYLENGYYHIYNRGVEKRDIFLDKQDYSVFLSYLKEYLLPKDKKLLNSRLSDPDISPKERDKVIKSLRMNNFSNEIILLAYSLLPNHFHLLLKQINRESINHLLRSIGTRYTMYFNRKYKRVGHLYQGVYKAVLVTSNEQLLHLTRYIHKQALALNLQGESLEDSPSSYGEYVGIRKTRWVKPEEILSFFSKHNPSLSYQSFIRQASDSSIISKLLLEE